MSGLSRSGPNPADSGLASIYEKGVRAGLRAYKLTLSPYIGQACRFKPSCSEYMAEALITHGPLLGSWLGVKRICRCRPGGGHGFDPVPRKGGTSPRPRA